jgi:hypothetical protein
MKVGPRNVLLFLTISALAATANGCKKAEENGVTTNPGSSGVMSSTTGSNGVAGEGKTASNADAAAASEAAPESQAPVATSPSTGASAAPAGASQ